MVKIVQGATPSPGFSTHATTRGDEEAVIVPPKTMKMTITAGPMA